MNDYITKFLGLANVCVDNIVDSDFIITISISTTAHALSCPCCGTCTARVHDYREQRIKDLPYRNKHIILVLRKRRYICPHCNKRFLEKYSFLPRYHHMTRRVYENILHELRSNCSMKSVAQRFALSANTVARVFGIVNYSLHKLPEVLAIDEFKGNTDNEKYQCILTNPQSGKLLDILPSREQGTIFDFFKSFKQREHVKLFIMDMWEPYKGIAKLFFPKAKIVIDKYHYVRQVSWALDNVRRRVQKRFAKEKRVYFKRSRFLLHANYRKLSEENQQALRLMISQHSDLHDAWQLGQLFYDFRLCNNSIDGRKILHEWILTAQESRLPEFDAAITAFINWFEYILNSKDTPLTNAFTEGKNNKIKVLKRNAYGYRNFARFRNRILHCG